MKKLFGVLFILLFVFCKTANDNKEVKQAQALTQLEGRIDSLFHSNIESIGPGAALMVAYDGQLLIGKGYGLRNLETKEPITPSTNMRMGSVSKQFTDLAVLSLIDNGLLKPTDTVYKFWPYEVFKKITVQQLIDHTSGIADYETYFIDNWNRSDILENTDVLAWLATNPEPLFEPGEKWEYSNTAYLVLALLVEKLGGQEFSAYAKAQVFEKAGMQHTNYYNLAHPIAIEERAFCYEKDSLGQWKKSDGFFMNGVMGDGAVYTSVNDYFNYDQALRKETLVSKASHDLIFKPTSMPLPKEAAYTYGFLNGAEERYAMGWFVTEDFALHSGSWVGTRTMVVRDLHKPLTIAIFLNSDQGELRQLLMESTYRLVADYLTEKTKEK